MNWGYDYRPYVPVAQRKRNGIAQAKKKIGKGKQLQPIEISGSKIAKTFWGKSWCDHFETYSDFSNRLPRGRTYAKNGSIAHLEITSGKITAMVCGSNLYQITINIDALSKKAWKHICDRCTTSVHSVIDLMLGKLPDSVIMALTDPKSGLFPSNREIKLSCDCPDGARLCKHLAAVLYGVGNRLDDSPELFFLLRGVDQHDLIGSSLTQTATSLLKTSSSVSIESSDLEDIFGIELVENNAIVATTKAVKKRAKKKKTAKKATKKKAAKKVVKKKATKKSKT